MIDSLHSTTRQEMKEFRKGYFQLGKRFDRFDLLHDRFF